jgi:hypothetical protein
MCDAVIALRDAIASTFGAANTVDHEPLPHPALRDAIASTFGAEAKAVLLDAATSYIQSGHLELTGDSGGGGVDAGMGGSGNNKNSKDASNPSSVDSTAYLRLVWPDGYLLEHTMCFTLVSAVADIIHPGNALSDKPTESSSS